MESKGYPVSSMLCVTPTFLQLEHAFPESDIAFIISEYDGDVIGLDGFVLYDLLNEKTNGSHSATLLKKANHNYFNSNLEHNDAMIRYKEAEIMDQITRESQENFLKNFAVDFVLGSLKDEHHTAYNLDNSQPNTMYGEDVKVLLKKSDSSEFVDYLILKIMI